MKDLLLSNNVYELRTAKHISQDKMAQDLGVCRRTISKIENNDQNLSLEMAYRITTYFDKLVPEVFPPNETNEQNGSLSSYRRIKLALI